MIIYRLPFKPASVTWQAVANDSTNTSYFTGNKYIYQYANQQWTVNLSFPPLTEKKAMQLQGMCLGLMDKRNALEIAPLELDDSNLGGRWISCKGNLYMMQSFIANTYMGVVDPNNTARYEITNSTTVGDNVTIPEQVEGNPFPNGDFGIPTKSVSIYGKETGLSAEHFIANVGPGSYTFDKTDNQFSGTLGSKTFTSYKIYGNVYDDSNQFGAALLYPNKRSNFDVDKVNEYVGRTGSDDREARAYFRISDNFTFDIDVAKTVGITIPLEEYLQPADDTQEVTADNIYINTRDYKYYEGRSSFRGFYFYGTDVNTSATKGYYYPLFTDPDEAKYCDYPIRNTARTYHTHTFEEAPGLVFYMPTTNNHHTESSLGYIDYSMWRLYYQEILTRHYLSGDNIILRLNQTGNPYLDTQGASIQMNVPESDFESGESGNIGY